MHVSVITIFPELFDSFLSTSLLGRAVAAGLISVDVHDLRDFTSDLHRVVDDEPYGGGEGMVMCAEPWLEAVRSVSTSGRSWRVLLSPQGGRLTDAKARALAGKSDLVLMCGRYEGVDERVAELAADEEISIGDFVLSGGEVAAMALIEAVSRQIPGVVGDPRSVENESFRGNLLDHPHYTRPREVEDKAVPEVLVSGDHAAIERWRRQESLRRTLLRRPDLLAEADLSGADRKFLADLTRADGADSGPSPPDDNPSK